MRERTLTLRRFAVYVFGMGYWTSYRDLRHRGRGKSMMRTAKQSQVLEKASKVTQSKYETGQARKEALRVAKTVPLRDEKRSSR